MSARSFGWRAALAVLARLPQGALSRAAGWLADRRIPSVLRRPLLGTFARAVGANVAEAAEPLEAYPSLNAFFVRALRDGVHRWPDDPRAVASPVDGVVGSVGAIVDGTLVQAKGRHYPVAELLGDEHAARRFEGGSFITLYLAPRHYHRIHAPVTGGIAWARHVPGGLLPVNRPAVAHVDRLFARNERLAAMIETASGPVVLVAVGAFNVGRISAGFDPAWSGEARSWITNRRTPPEPERHYRPPIPLATGDPFMAFHLGSTVVLTLPAGSALATMLEPGVELRAGSILAHLPAPPHLPGD